MLAITELRSSLRPRPKEKQQLIIVGNGMTSHRLCRLLSESEACRERYEITVLGEELVPAYDRIRLSESLERAGEPVLLDSEAWYGEQNIVLQLGKPATHIDRATRTVVCEDGSALHYDKLVLATGAAALVPPVPGVDTEGVHVYRTIADTRRITEAAKAGAKVGAVVGGGLLGLEAARVLRELGLRVHVIEHSKSLMPRQLDADSGALLDKFVREQGVTTHLGRKLASIKPGRGDSKLSLEFDAVEDGLDVDVLVMAVGIRPRDELAKQAGLRLGSRGGIIVDDALRTSDPNIFALGECAVHRGTHYGLVAPGYEMADVLAARFGGIRKRFRKADTSCQLKLLDVPVAAVGAYEREARAVTYESDTGRRTIVIDGSRLIGATTVGDWPQLVRVQDAALREMRISRRQLALFEETGDLWANTGGSGVADWPERTVVCNCTGVTRGSLSACAATCAEEGLVSVDALTKKTGAGSVCGSCKPLLGELVGQPVSAERGGRIPLIAASVITVLVGVALFLIPSLHDTASVKDPQRELALLLRDETFKQWTGFGAVGLVALGMLLSARKRLSWFKKPSVGAYRALHGVVGVLALALTGVHAGMRMGEGENFALMTVFLAASVIGAFAGVAAALESGEPGSLSTQARKLRTPLSLTHLLILWPLPVLLAVHIFTAYYF